METQPYASLSRRFGALFIDTIILGVIATIGGHIIPILGAAVVWFFYAPILESSEIRATIGKQLMGIQVVDLMGRRLSFRAALLRNFMKLFSTAFLCLGFLIAFFSARKQSMHDLVADSVVIYGRSDTPIVDAWMEHSKEILRMRDTDSSVARTSSQTSSQTTSRRDSVATELERLQALFEKGVLTAQEFESAKKKVIEV